jgi:antirestriction protein ArdC
MPYNPTSAKEYRGGNAVNLMVSALEQGFTDPRWLTYRQAAENDWQVRSQAGTGPSLRKDPPKLRCPVR